MRKTARKLLIILLAIVMSVLPITYTNINVADAHSGRTDSRGGHKDNKNKSGLGSYHYHCGGNPAHLHKDGTCPYASTSIKSSQKDTKKSSSQSSNKSTTTKTNETDKKNATKEKKSKKDIIKEVQKALNGLGYDCGKVDGINGKKTKSALKKFQKDYGLKVDGIIGKQVKSALNISDYKD